MPAPPLGVRIRPVGAAQGGASGGPLSDDSVLTRLCEAKSCPPAAVAAPFGLAPAAAFGLAQRGFAPLDSPPSPPGGSGGRGGGLRPSSLPPLAQAGALRSASRVRLRPRPRPVPALRSGLRPAGAPLTLPSAEGVSQWPAGVSEIASWPGRKFPTAPEWKAGQGRRGWLARPAARRARTRATPGERSGP